jgi:hypothetical protein
MRSGATSAVFAALLFLGLPSCQRDTATFSKEKFEKLNASTEQEAVAALGPGEEVVDSYTRQTAAVHKLPEGARFLRWQDPKEPGVYYHVVVVDGKVVKHMVWDSRPK